MEEDLLLCGAAHDALRLAEALKVRSPLPRHVPAIGSWLSVVAAERRRSSLGMPSVPPAMWWGYAPLAIHSMATYWLRRK